MPRQFIVMCIADIAKAANVSYATAWRVINNHPCASERAVAAVRQAMQLHGYSTQPSNGGKRRGRPRKDSSGIRTHNVALLHLREGTNISSFVLSAVQRLLAERNLNLIFAHVDSPDDLPQAVRAGNVDGILGYGQFPSAAVTPKLEKIPAVWLMSREDASPDQWGDRVRPDHEGIGVLAARAMLKNGHRHVGVMNPDASHVGTYNKSRCDAATTTCEQAGVRVDRYDCAGLTDRDTQAQHLVEQFLAAAERPTALFVPVDRVTLRIYHHLLRRGLHPGRDVELVSCDNEQEILSLMHPRPLSVDLDRHTIAGLAVDRLLWRMKNGTASPRVVITVAPTIPALAQPGVPAKPVMTLPPDSHRAAATV